MHFSQHMEKAWQDTMMPFSSPENKQKGKFLHYFLGWPKVRGDQSLLRTIIFSSAVTLSNCARRPPELFFNLLAEISGWTADQLTTSENSVLKTLSLIPRFSQATCKLGYYLIRFYLDPMTSYLRSKNAWTELPSGVDTLNTIVHAVSIANHILPSMLLGMFMVISIFTSPVLLIPTLIMAAGLFADAAISVFTFMHDQKTAEICRRENCDTAAAMANARRSKRGAGESRTPGCDPAFGLKSAQNSDGYGPLYGDPRLSPPRLSASSTDSNISSGTTPGGETVGSAEQVSELSSGTRYGSLYQDPRLSPPRLSASSTDNNISSGTTPGDVHVGSAEQESDNSHEHSSSPIV